MKKTGFILLLLLNSILVSAQRGVAIEILIPLDTLGVKPVGYEAIKNGDYLNAIKDLTKAIRLSPNRAHYYYNRALSYDAIGKYDEAIADYNKALSLEKIPEAQSGIGIIYMKLEKFKEAIPYFNKAIELNRALLFGRLQDQDRILDLEKSKAETLQNLAFAYENLEEFENADKYYEEAILSYSKLLIKSPKDTDLLSHRANCYSLMDQPEDAIKDYSQILSLAKSKLLISNTYYLRAKEYANLEEFEDALKDFDACLKISPDNGTALFYRATCKLQIDPNADACADYKSALKNGFTSSVDYKQIMADDPDYIDDLFSDCK